VLVDLVSGQIVEVSGPHDGVRGLLVHYTTQLELLEFGVQRGFTGCWLLISLCTVLTYYTCTVSEYFMLESRAQSLEVIISPEAVSLSPVWVQSVGPE